MLNAPRTKFSFRYKLHVCRNVLSPFLQSKYLFGSATVQYVDTRFVTVIIVGYWPKDLSSNLRRDFVLRFMPMSMGKKWIYLFLPEMWSIVGQNMFSNLAKVTSLGEEKLNLNQENSTQNYLFSHPNRARWVA